jgi:hypothetical protein
MPDFKSLAILVSGFFSIFAWLLYGNKKQEVEKLEKETAEKDLINKDLVENAEIKRKVANTPFADLPLGLRRNDGSEVDK